MHPIVSFFIFIDKVFARVVESLIIFALISMTLLVASQIVLRNFFNSGIDWADVAARHTVLWVAFMGAMLATRSRQHIAIDVLTRFIPRTPRNAVRIVLDAFSCVVALLLAHASLNFVIEERAMGSILFADVPTWIVQTIIPFGFAMISLEYAIGIGLDIWRLAHGSSGQYVAGRGRQ